MCLEMWQRPTGPPSDAHVLQRAEVGIPGGRIRRQEDDGEAQDKESVEDDEDRKVTEHVLHHHNHRAEAIPQCEDVHQPEQDQACHDAPQIGCGQQVRFAVRAVVNAMRVLSLV